MRSPRFGATILVLVLLAVLGVGFRAFRSLIPPSSPNRLALETGDFLRQGAYEQIDWMPMGPGVFTEARRLDRSIMLVIGTPWSRLGRVADSGVFSDAGVQMLLKRAFVCVRVDGCREPDWLNAYLPFSRAPLGVLPDFQIWFLDPTGKPFDAILVQSTDDQLEYDSFMPRLLAAQEKSRLMRSEVPAEAPVDVGQKADLDLLGTAGPQNSPSFERHLQDLAQATDPRYGGYPNTAVRGGGPPYQRLPAQPLRFLLVMGEYDRFRSVTDAAIRSPIVDRLDGGFFLRSASADWMKPEYDKSAVQNAELMQVFALAGALLKDRSYEEVAKSTFDNLAAGFESKGLVMACRVGDEIRGGRSARSSFAPPELRKALGNLSVPDGHGGRMNAYVWARDRLQLQVETNPRMLIAYRDPLLPTKEPEALASVLKALRDSAADREPTYAEPELSEVNFTVAARMIWCARLWGDPGRKATAQQLFDRTRQFVLGDEVMHGTTVTRPGCAYLGDYLAYADAALQDFLAFGDAESFESGLKVLQRARVLFRNGPSGQWNMVSKSMPGAQMIDCPEIADNVGESCTARVIRLLYSYGRLLRDAAPTADRRRTRDAGTLSQDALSAIGQFAAIAASMGPSASGYFTDALGVMDDAHAFAVGPNRHAQASELFRLVPTRLVACCEGMVRRDLGARASGVYVVRASQVDGPLSVQAAAAMLSRPGPSHP